MRPRQLLRQGICSELSPGNDKELRSARRKKLEDFSQIPGMRERLALMQLANRAGGRSGRLPSRPQGADEIRTWKSGAGLCAARCEVPAIRAQDWGARKKAGAAQGRAVDERGPPVRSARVEIRLRSARPVATGASWRLRAEEFWRGKHRHREISAREICQRRQNWRRSAELGAAQMRRR